MKVRKITKNFVVLAFSLLLTISPTMVESNISNAKTLKEATFAYLDVGQGNAELIKVGNKSILFDTGKGSEYDELTEQLSKLKVKAISTLIVSHPDADHMENADKFIANYHVKKIIYPKVSSSTQCFKRMTASIKKYNVKKIHPSSGQSIKLAKSCKAEVLSVDASSDKNEASLVLRVTYGSRSFLYMGDATARVEAKILASGSKIASDVYLLSHHGSDTANGVLFQKRALSSKYKVAVISVGARNSYGHPVKTVVNRAKKFAKKLLRTDQNGAIVFKTNGNKLSNSFIKVTHSSSGSYSQSETSTTNNNTESVGTKGYVYITKTGSKYHKSGCRYLRSSKIKVKLSEAKAKGLEPCSVCN